MSSINVEPYDKEPRRLRVELTLTSPEGEVYEPTELIESINALLGDNVPSMAVRAMLTNAAPYIVPEIP